MNRSEPVFPPGDPVRRAAADHPVSCPLAVTLADRLRGAREELTRRWLERIAARVSVDPNRVFPTDDLLNHVPLLIDGVADYLADPADEIVADFPVVAKARELGELRYRQGFDVHEILKEHEILAGIIFAFLTREVDEIDEPCLRSELLECAHRISRAVEVIRQATMGHFLQLLDTRVREREERLQRFNRMVSHELKTHLGALTGARAMLREPWIGESDRARFEAMVDENAAELGKVLENLETLSRLSHAGAGDQRQHRNVLLPQAVRESVRQLREYARSRGVVVRIESDLPEVEVNAAAVELCLSNYISNAIKYSDPGQQERWVEIRAWVRGPTADRGSDLVVEVRDNGLGVPEEARARLFDPFYRAHEGTMTSVEGTGLGLSIVRETVEALGGVAWADFDSGESGRSSCFAFALPSRRSDDDRRASGRPAIGPSPVVAPDLPA